MFLHGVKKGTPLALYAFIPPALRFFSNPLLQYYTDTSYLCEDTGFDTSSIGGLIGRADAALLGFVQLNIVSEGFLFLGVASLVFLFTNRQSGWPSEKLKMLRQHAVAIALALVLAAYTFTEYLAVYAVNDVSLSALFTLQAPLLIFFMNYGLPNRTGRTLQLAHSPHVGGIIAGAITLGTYLLVISDLHFQNPMSLSAYFVTLLSLALWMIALLLLTKIVSGESTNDQDFFDYEIQVLNTADHDETSDSVKPDASPESTIFSTEHDRISPLVLVNLVGGVLVLFGVIMAVVLPFFSLFGVGDECYNLPYCLPFITSRFIIRAFFLMPYSVSLYNAFGRAVTLSLCAWSVYMTSSVLPVAACSYVHLAIFTLLDWKVSGRLNNISLGLIGLMMILLLWAIFQNREVGLSQGPSSMQSFLVGASKKGIVSLGAFGPLALIFFILTFQERHNVHYFNDGIFSTLLSPVLNTTNINLLGSESVDVANDLVIYKPEKPAVDFVYAYYDENLSEFAHHIRDRRTQYYPGHVANRVIIYNKGPHDPLYLAHRLSLDVTKGDQVIALPNTGREGGTYLTHIVLNYATEAGAQFHNDTSFPVFVRRKSAWYPPGDTSSEMTPVEPTFLDNTVFEEVLNNKTLADYVDGDLYRRTGPHHGFGQLTYFLQPHLAWDHQYAEPHMALVNSSTGFMHLGPYVLNNCLNDFGNEFDHLDGTGAYNPVHDIFSTFVGTDCSPGTWMTSGWSAQFVVSRERIMENAFENYRAVNNLLNAGPDNHIHEVLWAPGGARDPSNPAFGHSVERSWPAIFNCFAPSIAKQCTRDPEFCQCLDGGTRE